MPVPRARRGDDQVDYVVVKRSGVEIEEEDVQPIDARFEPTTIVKEALSPSKAKREAPKFDDDSDDDDDFPIPTGTFSPAPILVTATLPQAQATGGTALADNDPTETVVVSISPPPPPPPPPHHENKGGISQTTEHLLIAAGSIGATIVVVMIIMAIYTMRKRGMTLAEAVKHGKYQVTRRGPPPTPPKRAQNSWDNKQAYNNSDYGAMRNDTVTPPQPAMARSGSFSSQRPLMALERSDSYRTQIVDRSVSPNTVPQSFLLDSPPSRNNSNRTHQRNDSGTPSSPVLPISSQRRSASTHNTRSELDDQFSAQNFPEPPQERSMSPLPPPPTFKQFLFNRPSISGRPGFGGASAGGPMVSRFSWTNSQAPQTPHDPTRDTNSHTIGRDSFMTQRSSIPRFRTVDSWVNQQTNRLEEQKLREQFRLTTTSTVYEGEDSRIPEVPDLPKNVEELRETPNSAIQVQNRTQPLPPRTPPSGGLPGKNIKHERHDTRTTVDTAPIFRQHPGTEVRFSKRSAVPSEILDMGMKNNVLS